jgi:hypothetical protein
MSITKSLVFDKVTINAIDYTPHLADSAEVTIEPVNQTVENGQTLVSAWDVSFSVDLLNTAVSSSVDVYTNHSEHTNQDVYYFWWYSRRCDSKRN